MTPHITCFAHAIHLAAQNVLKLNEVQRLLDRVKRIVAVCIRDQHESSTLTEARAFVPPKPQIDILSEHPME